MKIDYQILEKKIKINFKDKDLLTKSLTHKSFNKENNNEKIELRGFGTFSAKHRLPKKARNPKTGDPIFLPERYVPVFKPSKLMKKTVNEKLIEY